ncbi:MAG: DUF2085 domain-containing protein [Coriobacteriia bacterium]|nr:DUF2085 domain-containing protein [Coriobacteriia bacterium]MCL2749802.1 DUF2085 domain-containing protein [Coriobacteriia bacterium]
MYEVLQQILNFFGHGFCHQYSERSLEVGELFFCVCARCTGIYLGLIITLVVAALVYSRRSESKAARQKWAIVVGVVLVIPMSIDGGGSYAGLFETTNLNRYITGYLSGMGLGIIASGGLVSILPRSSQSQRAISTPAWLTAVLLISAAAGALFYLGYPYWGIAGPLISLASLWLAVTFVLLLLVSTTKLWTPATPAPRRAVLVALCLLAALAAMAVFSLSASFFGFIVPWYPQGTLG